jgi:hypothetical protein
MQHVFPKILPAAKKFFRSLTRCAPSRSAIPRGKSFSRERGAHSI